MFSEVDRMDIRKAMAYDLLRILKQNPEKAYSMEDLEKLIDAYITGVQQ